MDPADPIPFPAAADRREFRIFDSCGSARRDDLTTLYLLFSIAAAFIPLTIAIFPDGMVPFMEEIFFLFHYLFLNPLFYFHESASGGCIFAALVGYTVSVSALFLLFTVYVLYTADLNEAQ